MSELELFLSNNMDNIISSFTLVMVVMAGFALSLNIVFKITGQNVKKSNDNKDIIDNVYEELKK